MLLTGQVDAETNPLIKWFEQEPSVDATAVITRPSGLITVEEIKGFVRLYFPRTYQQVRFYDLIILHSPEMYHLTQEHKRDLAADRQDLVGRAQTLFVSQHAENPWYVNLTRALEKAGSKSAEKRERR